MSRRHTHFVYRCLDTEGRVIYVGCTKDVAARMKQHGKTGIAEQTHRLRVTVHPSRDTALEVEREQIALHEPRLNRQIYLMDIASWPEAKLRERLQAELKRRPRVHFRGDANSAIRCLRREYARRFGPMTPTPGSKEQA
ncbi:GIY-YIG nuclease family protein [Brachybacterium sp. SGAir0954]|uniref:GIY-YIG nuclease family protein n=1 Tax=Brachybacterium sp. SGAir0954 TaxID=2571029 RepID=UPI00143D69DA|nr:GIY-YIG nuclease family protein [Brachybacterium sp. SGAir0954]